jgi:hypothetical protein
VLGATLSDWEEGSQFESGIENYLAVAAAIASHNVNFSVSGGTGDESTLDHYVIWYSPDATITDPGRFGSIHLGTVAPGVGTFDLAGRGLIAGTAYKIYVEAVGKGQIRNHMSAGS